jgi:hypothetical protein
MVTKIAPNVPQSQICQPYLNINLLLFLALNFSIMMNMPWIASSVVMLLKICRMLKEHPWVSSLSAA